ncbi:MAG: DUF971 domain-containing protein [Terriglobales bacterium]
MSEPSPAAAVPANIDVSLSQGITIAWRDGRTSRYSVAQLRAACPCATCADLHHTGERPTAVPASPLPIYKPAGHRLTGVTPVGRYALQLHFSDGHATGIFTFEYLRDLDPGAKA